MARVRFSHASHRCHGGIPDELNATTTCNEAISSPSDDDSTVIVNKHRLVGTSFADPSSYAG